MNYREHCPCGAKLELEDVSITTTAANVANQWRREHEQSEVHKLWVHPPQFIEEDDGIPDLGNYDSEEE